MVREISDDILRQLGDHYQVGSKWGANKKEVAALSAK